MELSVAIKVHELLEFQRSTKEQRMKMLVEWVRREDETFHFEQDDAYFRAVGLASQVSKIYLKKNSKKRQSYIEESRIETVTVSSKNCITYLSE